MNESTYVVPIDQEIKRLMEISTEYDWRHDVDNATIINKMVNRLKEQKKKGEMWYVKF